MEEIWTTASIMDAILSRHPAKLAVYNRLNVAVKRLEAEIWFNGFQTQNRAARERGQRQKVRTSFERLVQEDTPSERVSILAYTIAGGTMITLDRGEVSLSVVADETSQESRTGLQGLYGTEADVVRLVDDAIAQWKAYPFIEPDQDVHIAGFPPTSSAVG